MIVPPVLLCDWKGLVAARLSGEMVVPAPSVFCSGEQGLVENGGAGVFEGLLGRDSGFAGLFVERDDVLF